MNSIHEKDWKLLRAMQEEKLNQACEEILGKIEIEIKCKKAEKHKAYLKVWEIVNSGDKHNKIGGHNIYSLTSR